MKKERNLLLVTSALLILCYQNCGQSGFSISNDALNSVTDGSGGVGSPSEDSGESNPSSPTAPVSTVPTPTPTPAPTLTPTPTPTPPSGGASYSPMVIYNFDTTRSDSGTISAPFWSSRTRYVSTTSVTGDRSLQVTFQHGVAAYGFTQDLPQNIGPGETVWYRLYLYLPPTLSFSFINSASDGGDGFGFNKFLVLSPLGHGSPRMYVQPRSARRANFGDSNFDEAGFFVNHDELGRYCYPEHNGSMTYQMPRGRWFALQMAWQMRTDNTAWIRVWSDTELVAECQGAGQVASNFRIQNFGIGDYWNGTSYIGTGATTSFWVDSIVITKQTPTTTDSGGRPFIHPNDFR